jgi:hypothetical protein
MSNSKWLVLLVVGAFSAAGISAVSGQRISAVSAVALQELKGADFYFCCSSTTSNCDLVHGFFQCGDPEEECPGTCSDGCENNISGYICDTTKSVRTCVSTDPDCGQRQAGECRYTGFPAVFCYCLNSGYDGDCVGTWKCPIPNCP